MEPFKRFLVTFMIYDCFNKFTNKSACIAHNYLMCVKQFVIDHFIFQSGQLNEYEEHKSMSSDVVCLALASVPQGEQRSWFLAVGLADKTVRIISLNPEDCLTLRSTQALPDCAESLCIVEMGCTDRNLEDAASASTTSSLYLNIGLQNGTLLRTVLDPTSGGLSDTRPRYLGSRPVKLFRIKMQDSEAVLAMSSRSWLSYYYQSRFYLTPLSYECLEYASGFSSEQCSEGKFNVLFVFIKNFTIGIFYIQFSTNLFVI